MSVPAKTQKGLKKAKKKKILQDFFSSDEYALEIL